MNLDAAERMIKAATNEAVNEQRGKKRERGEEGAEETPKKKAKKSKKATEKELMALGEYIASLHSDCDFLVKNFDLRKEARASEIVFGVNYLGINVVFSSDRTLPLFAERFSVLMEG